MSDTGGLAPAGWHPDPENPSGSLRWWDGTRWTAHVHPLVAAPFPASVPASGPDPSQPSGGYHPHPSWSGNAGAARGSGRINQASLTAIGVAALYVLVAVTTHFVFVGIVPVMASVRAVRRREPMAALAVVAAVIAVVVGISAFAR